MNPEYIISNILIGCEESQVVCKAFRDNGYKAVSCDLVKTRGNPEWHLQCDIIDAIKLKKWNLIILHPDCTAMAVSGNRWYGRGMKFYKKRVKAVEWTKKLWDLSLKYGVRVALENPVSVIFKYLKNVHYIQPWQFGHGETKKTGLSLHNLEPLKPTSIVGGRDQRIWKMGPSKTRKRDRSVTYKGIADAMAKQWGKLL